MPASRRPGSRRRAAVLGVAGAIVGLGSLASLTVVATLLALLAGVAGAVSVVRWDAETAETRFGVALVAAAIAALGNVVGGPVMALPAATSAALSWLALRETRAVLATDRRAWADRVRLGSEAIDPDRPPIPRTLVEREHPVLRPPDA